MPRRTNEMSTMRCFFVAFSLVLIVQLTLCDSSSNSSAISDLNMIKNDVTDYAETVTASSSVKKQKPLFTTGNELWDGVIRDCLRKPTFSCLQKNVYNYLDSTLALNDVNVTNRVQLTRNQIEFEIPEAPRDEENEIHFEGRGK